MAKAKKSEKNEDAASSPEKKPAARKKTSKPATGTGDMPSINTSLAAENAAKSLIAGLNRKPISSTSGAKSESAAFKQMKSGLNKPAGSMGNLLDKTHGPPALGGGGKLNQPFGGAKQVGHNQTFGADVNRAGVPRRTGGG